MKTMLALNRFGVVATLALVSALVFGGCSSSENRGTDSSVAGAGGLGKLDAGTGGMGGAIADASVSDSYSPPDVATASDGPTAPDSQPQLDAQVVADAPVLDGKGDTGTAPDLEAGVIDTKSTTSSDGPIDVGPGGGGGGGGKTGSSGVGGAAGTRGSAGSGAGAGGTTPRDAGSGGSAAAADGGPPPTPSFDHPCVIEGWGNPVQATFSADGSVYGFGTQAGVVKIIRTADDQPLVAVAAHDAPVTALAISADGSLFASAGTDGTIRVWDLASDMIANIAPIGGAILGLALSPDGKRVASVGQDDFVVGRVFSIPQSQLVSTLSWNNFQNYAHVVEFAPDSGNVVTYGNQIVRWNPATGAMLGAVTLENPPVIALMDVSADGSTVATGYSDAITIFDGHSGQTITSIFRRSDDGDAPFVGRRPVRRRPDLPPELNLGLCGQLARVRQRRW